MCDEAVDDFLAALKLIPDWFVTRKMIKKLDTALQADEHILYFNEDSADVTFCCDEMGIISVNLNNINLDNNFDEDYPDTIIFIGLLPWHIKFEKRKGLKGEELMSIVWHPKRWLNFSMPEDDKNRYRTDFYSVILLMYTV